MHARTHAYMHAYIHACERTHMCAYLCAYKRTYVRTCIQKRMCAHTISLHLLETWIIVYTLHMVICAGQLYNVDKNRQLYSVDKNGQLCNADLGCGHCCVFFRSSWLHLNYFGRTPTEVISCSPRCSCPSTWCPPRRAFADTHGRTRTSTCMHACGHGHSGVTVGLWIWRVHVRMRVRTHAFMSVRWWTLWTLTDGWHSYGLYTYGLYIYGIYSH